MPLEERGASRESTWFVHGKAEPVKHCEIAGTGTSRASRYCSFDPFCEQVLDWSAFGWLRSIVAQKNLDQLNPRLSLGPDEP